jgi:hypothetical protein
VTTPPTPAGWYPDPDGSGGQRYWDGSEWTEHRSPAAPEPAEPPTAAEPPGSEAPTADVQLQPTGGHVGAHRAPDSTPEPAEPAELPVEPEHTPEFAPPPEPGPTPEPVDLGSTVPSEQPTTPVFQSTPPAEPSYFSTPPEPPPAGEPAAPDDSRRLAIQFAVVCAALVAVLVAAVIFAVFNHKDNTVHMSSGPSSTSTSATPTSSDNGSGTETITTSEPPTNAPSAGAVTDGNFSFQVTDVETAPSVHAQDSPAEKTAQGQFIIVHMSVTNTGAMSATFLGTLQKLKAGGTMYSIDDEATAYLHGTVADTNPGDNTDVAVAFDVPAGTTPEAIELHGDPTTPGVEVPLS